jgi:8-oxo-dGTP pyrophosphatase MutT (NUDIX family)
MRDAMQLRRWRPNNPGRKAPPRAPIGASRAQPRSVDHDRRVIDPVVTSGVLLRWRDRFVFQTGLNRSGERLGVVRLGGHVEPGETPAECACREAREEANIAVRLVSAPTTHSYEVNAEAFDLVPTSWRSEPPMPLLVAAMTPEPGLSVTYLAESDDEPRPGAETQALLFLTADEVKLLATTHSRRTFRSSRTVNCGPSHGCSP